MYQDKFDDGTTRWTTCAELVLPEQTVLLTEDRDHAREVGGQWVRSYLKMPNYANNLRRLGFSDEEIDTVSDRLLDAVIAWGDEDAVKRRVAAVRRCGRDLAAWHRGNRRRWRPANCWAGNGAHP